MCVRRGVAARRRPAPERHAALGVPGGAHATLPGVLAPAERARPQDPPGAAGPGGPGLLHPVQSDGAGGAGGALRGGAAGGAGEQEGPPGARGPLGEAEPQLHGGHAAVTEQNRLAGRSTRDGAAMANSTFPNRSTLFLAPEL